MTLRPLTPRRPWLPVRFTSLGRLVVLAAASVAVIPAAASADTVIGFETDCAGGAIPGTFVPGLLGTYKDVDSGLFAPCGVSSISSGGTFGKQQLVQQTLFPIGGITGSTVLTGAVQVGGAIASTNSPIEIVFAPPVNRVAFDALDLDNANGLTVTATSAQGAVIGAPDKPVAQNKIVHYSRTSAVPIARISVAYAPAFLAIPGDGWFLDQLTFKAWICGDGVIDNDASNPAPEACDDGNRVQCDGCGNTCQPSLLGCLDGSTCVATGATSTCVTCSASTPVGPSGDRPTTPVAMNTPCDDNLFCTLPGACDGAGSCKSAPNTCDDGVVCTVDTCDEANDQCLHPIADKWCLIAGGCYPNGNANPSNVCQLCTAATSNTSWDQKPTGTQCGDPMCTSGVASTAATCNAGGVCQPGVTQNCMFMMCANSVTCDGRCLNDTQCPQQAYCDVLSETCLSDDPPGSACTRDAECSTGACADGVCCDKPCTGACESCRQPNKVGMCTLLPALSIDPDGFCAKGEVCSAAGACTIPPPPVTIHDGGVVTPPPSSLQPNGSVCGSAAVCATGQCVDGVCCESACAGSCESCAAIGSTPGLCVPIASGEDPDSECGAAAVCDGRRACESYETRGNGLCAATPGQGGSGWSWWSLLAVGATLAQRRRRGRRAA